MRCLLPLLLLFSACAAGRCSLLEENDFFTAFNKDHDYTQGARLEYEGAQDGFAIGQRVYTPTQKRIADVVPEDRPYSGLLYAERSWNWEQSEEGWLPTAGLQAGLVGPSALGEEAQCGVHKMLDQSCPAGWSHQLRDEPVLNGFLRIRRYTPTEFLFTVGTLISETQLEVGNGSTALRAGTSVEYWLTDWLTVWAGPKAHIVARDITLDGNTWRDSHSVDRNWFYSELTGGFKTRIGNLGVEWFLTVQTKQYESQAGSYNYGGVRLTWEVQ